jgi:hypothetical protein
MRRCSGEGKNTVFAVFIEIGAIQILEVLKTWDIIKKFINT